jgi:hypothetical protein
MNDIDKSWIKWIVAAVVLGFLAGELIYRVLDIVIVSASFVLLKNLAVPLCVIVGLLIVLYFYNKNKYEK